MKKICLKSIKWSLDCSVDFIWQQRHEFVRILFDQMCFLSHESMIWTTSRQTFEISSLQNFLKRWKDDLVQIQIVKLWSCFQGHDAESMVGWKIEFLHEARGISIVQTVCIVMFTLHEATICMRLLKIRLRYLIDLLRKKWEWCLVNHMLVERKKQKKSFKKW